MVAMVVPVAPVERPVTAATVAPVVPAVMAQTVRRRWARRARPAATVALADAQGLVLADDVVARLALPVFDNSAMDGYAVRAEDTAAATPEHPVVLPVAEDIPAARVEQVVRQAAGALAEEVTLFDVYEGDQVPEGHRSLAFALRLRAVDHTLTAEESAQVRHSVVKRAHKLLGAELRS